MTEYKKIIATFQDGKEIIYTTNILLDLMTDKNILTIIDAATGEVIYNK